MFYNYLEDMPTGIITKEGVREWLRKLPEGYRVKFYRGDKVYGKDRGFSVVDENDNIIVMNEATVAQAVQLALIRIPFIQLKEPVGV